MVQTAGEGPTRENMRIEELTLKTTTGCTKGDLLCYDTDGYAPATQSLSDSYPSRYAVALATVTAGTSGHKKVRAVVHGPVGVRKVNNTTTYFGQALGASTTAGKASTLSITDYKYKAGYAGEASVSGDSSVLIFVE